MKDKDNIIKGDCWLAYFDILGFKNRIFALCLHQSILEQYDKVIEEIKRLGKYYDTIKKIWFSDSFLFYIKDDSRDSFMNLQNFATSFFYSMFIYAQIPMRGCMSYGDFYADNGENIYFGKGFIGAYEQAEGQQIIGLTMTEDVRDKLTKYSTNNPNNLGENVWEHCKKYRWLEYDIPFKKSKKRRLPIYDLKLRDTINCSSHGPTNQQRLQNALTSMKDITKMLFKEELKEQKKALNLTQINNCLVYKGIMKKYKNTRKFLSTLSS